MRFPRLTHRVALGMGAIGLVLASGGAATAAVSAIQPAGALSAQVPAVGVREQNVNSAGRIRVALPKGSLGVSGSVSVSNLPENSAGQLKVAPATPSVSNEPHQASYGPWGTLSPGQTATVLSVTGSGTFTGLRATTNTNASDCWVNVVVDGQIAFGQACTWGAVWSPGNGAMSGGLSAGGGYEINYNPAEPLTYSKSLVVTIENDGGQSDNYWADVWYTTAS
ncbi:MAG: hypothetical protein ACYCTL_08450 [Acidimicrobiales bacterium]